MFCEDVPLRDRAADRGMLGKPLPMEIVASPLGDLAPEVVLPEGLGRSVLSSVRLDPAGLPSCSDAGPVE